MARLALGLARGDLGPELAFSDRAWSQFVRGIKQGEFDLA